MELSELTAYAREKYHIQEQRRWADSPGFSILCDPHTGKWVALLMRQWDSESGTQIERCDLKCGQQSLSEFQKSYLAAPLRMQGAKWINVAFDHRTEPEVVFKLFDRAITSGEQRGFTIVLNAAPSDTGGTIRKGSELFASDTGNAPKVSALRASDTGFTHNGPALPASNTRTIHQDSSLPVVSIDPVKKGSGSDKIYHDTALPFSGRPRTPAREAPPERLRQMRRLYEYGRESLEAKAKNFYRQGIFMQDYEDDAPWPGAFLCYFPTYHDLTTAQLRGYFSWRTKVRKGEFRPISTSAAYLYIYELLNGIGTSSPTDTLQKLLAFESGYLDSGIGDNRMRQNLHRWMLEFSVLKDLPAETARQYGEAAMLQKDLALTSLRASQDASDEEVFSALCAFAGKGIAESPVLTNDPDRGRHLFCEAWRIAVSRCKEQGKDLFTLCFGERKVRRWYPLANAIYYHRERKEDRDYLLNDSRTYRCRSGLWQVEAYESLYFDRNRFQGFLREADRLFRRYLKTGRYLREKPDNAWAVPLIELVIAADKQALIEAARPKITIDLSGLDRIRKDALTTRDSLLTEDDLQELEETEDYEDSSPADQTADELPEDLFSESPSSDDQLPGFPLSPVHVRVLRLLLIGESPADLIRQEHLMPSLVADAINEALFDEIGDTVLSCEEDTLSIVEDYREDLEVLFSNLQG